jgi:hypothetical protein
VTGPPYPRFARMDDETRRLVALALKGEATSEETKALVALGGWRAAAERLDREHAVAEIHDQAERWRKELRA